MLPQTWCLNSGSAILQGVMELLSPLLLRTLCLLWSTSHTHCCQIPRTQGLLATTVWSHLVPREPPCRRRANSCQLNIPTLPCSHSQASTANNKCPIHTSLIFVSPLVLVQTLFHKECPSHHTTVYLLRLSCSGRLSHPAPCSTLFILVLVPNQPCSHLYPTTCSPCLFSLFPSLPTASPFSISSTCNKQNSGTQHCWWSHQLHHSQLPASLPLKS